jgi:TM2 domain-containing membrane protein YozV
MKEKNVAGVLALFLGGFGVHRFYLNQNGLGVFYLIFCWFPLMWIIGLIDAIVFFSMDQDDFDRKYNKERFRDYRDTDFERGEYRHKRRAERRQHRRTERQYERRTSRNFSPPQRPVRKNNPYKASGVKKYKDFDYEGAIEDFEQALKIEPNDVATHFNLACSYSLNEEVEQAFYHLDRAVDLGFSDFKRIKEHDALAYLRIQPQFETFEKNGFRSSATNKAQEAKQDNTPPALDIPQEDLLSQEPDLLDQLKRLGDLRDKGLLTEAEFATQKKKLLG